MRKHHCSVLPFALADWSGCSRKLHHKPAQWLGNFLPAILQTAVSELQPEESSGEQSESLVCIGRETYSQPTAALGRDPLPWWLMSSCFTNALKQSPAVTGVLCTYRHLPVPRLWGLNPNESHQLGPRWTALKRIFSSLLLSLQHPRSTFSEVLSSSPTHPHLPPQWTSTL